MSPIFLHRDRSVPPPRFPSLSAGGLHKDKREIEIPRPSPPCHLYGRQARPSTIGHGTQMMQAPVRIHTYARTPAKHVRFVYMAKWCKVEERLTINRWAGGGGVLWFCWAS